MVVVASLPSACWCTHDANIRHKFAFDSQCNSRAEHKHLKCCKVHTCSLCLDLAGDVYLKQLKCYLLVHTGGRVALAEVLGAGARTGTAGKAGAGAGANMLPKADPGRTSALPDASLDGQELEQL